MNLSLKGSQSSPRRVAVPVLVKDGKPCSGGGGGGNGAVGAIQHHDNGVTAAGHHDPTEIGGMPTLLDVGLTGHHPGAGHHFHHGN
jgi:hypothetical protein